MTIHDIVAGKRAWRAQQARVNALPREYRIVYREMQRYFLKVGPVSLTDGDLLVGLLEFFEDGAGSGTGVIDLIGSDVAAFSDALIADSPTFADRQDPSAAAT